MRTYLLHEARAEFSKLVERALDGEPQRVTRYGKDAVMIVSEADWAKGTGGKATLADLFLKYAGEEGGDFLDRNEPLARQDRPLGSDFLADA
ncbi:MULTISPECIES: type II toxin-antitoxin system Phd/YefM family antitoxin [Methylorubrum]|uniref:Antitoxin n=1 Tax=Methylorubrum rhodesianum TaxID=29427 RepID=A0ABU9ZAR1_9HYPH|nr:MULTISPECIES: type II toxin-antitoxin system Phd/YefM family antitoxin [Methylorubrum]MBK3401229.1 type II toxin-antitoxin system Phd/YefM family antitoxin [Methylorubrum rhodesianum]MBY0143574.1 type II toxin-antitoxin system Phd/YefM family antitoxin [Methylorubrum populi]MCP1542161.1 prevent-host-death family protein [Methylorubrum extorquens]MCP1590494.1 prevent-host-death family protein [Methylorubrum extorquens]